MLLGDRDRDLDLAWGRMLDSFRASAELGPGVVANGPPDAALLPSTWPARDSIS